MTVYSNKGREKITDGEIVLNGSELKSVQEADLVITSNNVFQDTDIIIPLSVGDWLVELDIWAASHTTPDMEAQVVFTGTATTILENRTAIQGTGASTASATAFTVMTFAATQDNWRRHAHRISVSVAGDIKIQARQITSSATSVTFRGGSFMTATRLAGDTTAADSSDIFYDNVTSGLVAANVQDAIDEILASPLTRIGGFEVEVQEADLVHTSNTTYVDSDLAFDIPEAGTYLFEYSIQLTNNATPDTKVRVHYTGTNSASKQTGVVGLGGSAFMNTASVIDTDSVFTSAGLHSSTGWMVVVATSTGVLSLQTAQNASSVNSVTAPHELGWARVTRLL